MRDPESGLTLVEMLVALALFALVGLASLAMLEGVLRTRDGTEGRLEAVARIDRTLILFGRDFGQAEPGTISLEDGALSLVRPEIALTWSLQETALERRLEPADGVPLSQSLVPDVADLSFRILDATGAWQETWPADGADPLRARGVEMTLDLQASGPGAGTEPATVRRLVELPIGPPG